MYRHLYVREVVVDFTVASLKWQLLLRVCHCRLGVPGEPIPVSSEQDVFEIIGMDYKEPTERNLWGKLRPKSHW